MDYKDYPLGTVTCALAAAVARTSRHRPDFPRLGPCSGWQLLLELLVCEGTIHDAAGTGLQHTTDAEQYRARQVTEGVESWIVPNAQSQPQPKQRSEKARPSGRACTVYTAQMLWQIRNTSLAVAAPRQPIGSHACRACLPGPGAYRHADRLRLDERYGDRCQIAAKLHRVMRWRSMYRGVRTYVKHALRALS